MCVSVGWVGEGGVEGEEGWGGGGRGEGGAVLWVEGRGVYGGGEVRRRGGGKKKLPPSAATKKKNRAFFACFLVQNVPKNVDFFKNLRKKANFL